MYDLGQGVHALNYTSQQKAIAICGGQLSQLMVQVLFLVWQDVRNQVHNFFFFQIIFTICGSFSRAQSDSDSYLILGGFLYYPKFLSECIIDQQLCWPVTILVELNGGQHSLFTIPSLLVLILTKIWETFVPWPQNSS